MSILRLLANSSPTHPYLVASNKNWGSHTCSFVTQRLSISPGVLQSPIRDYDESLAELGPSPSPDPLADVPDTTQSSRRDLCSDSDAPENFMWPRFLSRLRNAFYLEPNSSPAEREIARLEARSSRATASHQSAEAIRLQAATESLPPRSVAIFLSKLCIQHGTDCFFYFDQPSFLAEVEEFYNDLSLPLRRDPSFLCLLLSVLALGAHWSPRARPSALSGSLQIPAEDPGQVFCGHARILMADTMDRDVMTAHLPQRRATDALQSFDNLDHQVANAQFVKIIDTLIEPASCGIAAKKMLNILEDASQSGNMAPRSFTDFQGCSIATIIVILTGILERDSAYDARVAFGLRCLRRMADLHMAGRMAVRFVEALISIAEEARAKVRPFGSTQFDGDVSQEASEYLLWTDWLNRNTDTSGTERNRSNATRQRSRAHSEAAQAASGASPMWEEAAALLQLRNPSTPNQALVVEDVALPTSAPELPEEAPFDLGLDADFPPATFAENHMQLMGLTGMDMLDFTFDI
ncbi:hypothetical protein CTAM01_13645 [Colletotrichum tamarilloi]|uniref:Transcription factor domain-containing protein n=1 Tax=Colletotrichum tamarilloi TaxID=1209934 RepID=A0ABQ9QRC8_9PEZI|nr:uncharacterized protein CTAM01_13645 [Colletotrichum tamarilloi]KAK1482192.1 hypothetical protein CTAM01_13645 [Colletotrichum tamarilloi]